MTNRQTPDMDRVTSSGETLGEIAKEIRRRRHMPHLIALTGPAGCGKSTAASHIPGAQRVRFAGPLKAMLRAYYRAAGLDGQAIDRRIEGDLKERPDPALGGVTPRHAMQTLGTEWGRACMGESFWVETMIRRLHILLECRRPVVIEDCRFENEAAAVRALGGVVIAIDRPGCGPQSAHASESGVIPDARVTNDGSPDDLVAAILSAAAEHRAPEVAG